MEKVSGRRASAEPATHEPSPSGLGPSGECQAQEVLGPCPASCGHKPRLAGNQETGWTVMCMCGWQGALEDTPERAINHWNNRGTKVHNATARMAEIMGMAFVTYEPGERDLAQQLAAARYDYQHNPTEKNAQRCEETYAKLRKITGLVARG